MGVPRARCNRQNQDVSLPERLAERCILALLQGGEPGAAFGNPWPMENSFSVVIDLEDIPKDSRWREALARNLIAALGRKENGSVPVKEVTFRKEGKAGVMTLVLDPSRQEEMDLTDFSIATLQP